MFRLFILVSLLLTSYTANAVSPICVAGMFNLHWLNGEHFYDSLPASLKGTSSVGQSPRKIAQKMTVSEMIELNYFLMNPALNLDPTGVEFDPEDSFLANRSMANKVLFFPLQTMTFGAAILRNLDRIHHSNSLMGLGEFILSNMPVKGGYRNEYFNSILDFFKDPKLYPDGALRLLKSLSINKEAMEYLGEELLRTDLSEQRMTSSTRRVVAALKRLRKINVRLTDDESRSLRLITIQAKQNLSSLNTELQVLTAEVNIRIIDRLLDNVSAQ